jgi:hypothetical protein
MCRKVLFFVLIYITSSPISAPSAKGGNTDGQTAIRFRAITEFGFLSVLSHKIQFGKTGTDFNYAKNGGQDVLFPVSRFAIEMDVGNRNAFILLYQPLRLATQDLLRNDLTVDNYTFPASRGVNFLYDFPFYRASYLRELLPEKNDFTLAVGGTIQIRDATISFESVDGSGFRTNRNIGVVPALKTRGCLKVAETYYLGFEADGIYAPVSYLNGSDNEVKGAILDASVRAGANVKPGSIFLNVRYLGGGATGTSTGDVWPGDGYVKNWLHFLIVSTGFACQF